MTATTEHPDGIVAPKVRLRKKGFTLIELMMTTAILSFGIVAIYEALFVSIDTYGYYTRYLDTQTWVNERIWEIQSELMAARTLTEGQTSGQVLRGQKYFDWIIEVKQLDMEQQLFQVDLTLSWQEGDRKIQTVRTAYLIPPELRAYGEDSAV